MAILLGDKRRFAAEVGDWDGPALRRVDLWAAGQWLTCDDNVAYVEQFRGAVADTALWLRTGHGSAIPFVDSPPADTHRRLIAGSGTEEADGELRRQFWLFDRWGPTTDNVLCFHFREGDRLVITAQFWREEHLLKHVEQAGRVFVVETRVSEFAGILEDLVAVLDRAGGAPVPG